MKLKKLKKGKNQRYKSRYQAGGMYSNNTVSSAGQGNVGNTSNIVYQESNPEILKQNLKSQEESNLLLKEQGESMTAKVNEMEEQSKIDIQTAADKVNTRSQAVSSTIQGSIKTAKQTGLIDKSAGSLGVGSAMTAYKAQKAINLGKKGYEGIKAGVQTAKQLEQSVKAAKLAKDSGTLLSYGQTGAEAGSAAGAGLSVLNNANVYALAANYAGKGIKKLSDDDDATTWTAGEATGDVLSSAGQYAGYGATIGSVVPGVGNAVGAVVGGVIGTGVGLYQGFAGRKKARKAEADALALKKKKISKHNKEVGSMFASQKSRVNAAQLAQKTYSGYDLGQNVVARKGGMRMGMPRYGYAA
tara:strand:- start:1316 stop:2386 length:1071 start_codon:yes stop_codon:yes gene_type:complete